MKGLDWSVPLRSRKSEHGDLKKKKEEPEKESCLFVEEVRILRGSGDNNIQAGHSFLLKNSMGLTVTTMYHAKQKKALYN